MRYNAMAQSYYRRNMPHMVPSGATLFITFRLAGSLPLSVIQALQKELEVAMQAIASSQGSATEKHEAIYQTQRAYFGKFDTQLDGSATGPDWLRYATVAELVKNELTHLALLDVVVLSFCIMPNHVHVVLQLPEHSKFSFQKMMQQLKGRTAFRANQLLQRSGSFWQHESYDHLVRDTAELQRINSYIVLNPVKAGLVENWEDWPHTFLL
jgi:REP element-mobilizing transposase RayT